MILCLIKRFIYSLTSVFSSSLKYVDLISKLYFIYLDTDSEYPGNSNVNDTVFKTKSIAIGTVNRYYLSLERCLLSACWHINLFIRI